LIPVVIALLTVVGQPALPFDQWRSDSAIGIQDAYKWIYQATQGGEHAAPSPELAASWLREEWTTLAMDAREDPLVEPLGDSRVVRVNLRPYRAAGGSPEALAAAFVRSAASFRPDREAFRRTWLELGDALRRGPFGQLTRAAWERLDSETRPKGYPAVHHSASFVASRRPAYRVLTSEEASRLVESLAHLPR
jgi:hypothetical protein